MNNNSPTTSTRKLSTHLSNSEIYPNVGLSKESSFEEKNDDLQIPRHETTKKFTSKELDTEMSLNSIDDKTNVLKKKN